MTKQINNKAPSDPDHITFSISFLEHLYFWRLIDFHNKHELVRPQVEQQFMGREFGSDRQLTLNIEITVATKLRPELEALRKIKKTWTWMASYYLTSCNDITSQDRDQLEEFASSGPADLSRMPIEQSDKIRRLIGGPPSRVEKVQQLANAVAEIYEGHGVPRHDALPDRTREERIQKVKQCLDSLNMRGRFKKTMLYALRSYDGYEFAATSLALASMGSPRVKQALADDQGDQGHHLMRPEVILAVLFGTLFLALVSYAALRSGPPLTAQGFYLIRVVSSVAAAGFGAVIPGFLDIKLVWLRNTIRAGGALAVFIIVYLVNPPAL